MNKINVIPNLLVTIKIAYSNKNKYAFCINNKFTLTILLLLYKDGLIRNFKIENNLIKIELKYLNNKPLFSKIENISKPSLKQYLSYEDLLLFNKKFDYFFISTSKGIISSKNLIKNTNNGGLVLFGLKLSN